MAVRGGGTARIRKPEVVGRVQGRLVYFVTPNEWSVTQRGFSRACRLHSLMYNAVINVLAVEMQSRQQPSMMQRKCYCYNVLLLLLLLICCHCELILFRLLLLQVLVEFDGKPWQQREWIKITEVFQLFLIEKTIVWAPKPGSQGDGDAGDDEEVSWPALVSHLPCSLLLS